MLRPSPKESDRLNFEVDNAVANLPFRCTAAWPRRPASIVGKLQRVLAVH